MKYYKNKLDDSVFAVGSNEFIRDLSQVEELTQEEVDTYELDNAKTAKINQVISNRNTFIYSPVEYNGSTFTNSEKSGNNLQAAYNFGTFPVNWLDIDGAIVELSKIQVGELISLIMSKRSSGYMQEASLIKQVNNADTLEGLNSIDIKFT